MNTRWNTLRMATVPLICAVIVPGCGDSLPSSPVPVAAVVPAQPIMMDYIKIETSPNSLNWLGTVTDDVNGALETRVVGARASGHILHIQTEWTVTAGTQSFEAGLNGILDTKTGRLVLNGQVISGYLAGAQVHDEGQLTGIDAVTGGTVFEGFLRIMPASTH